MWVSLCGRVTVCVLQATNNAAVCSVYQGHLMEVSRAIGMRLMVDR